MTIARYVLDTNIITAILKKEPTVAGHVGEALSANAEFLLCPVVFYEIYRGLAHTDAKKQLDFFLRYADTCTWDDLTKQDWQAAAKLWANLRLQGQSVQDSDLLIGVYAAQRNAIVVTDNEKHLAALGVTVENWRR